MGKIQRNFYFICFIVLFTNLNIYSQGAMQFPKLTQPYFGQMPPGDEPVLFAPGIVSTGMFTRDIAMTPDGNEIYFCISTRNYEIATIICSKKINGEWTKPEVADFASNPKYWYIEPCISSDGKKFFFISNKTSVDTGGSNRKTEMWVMDRNGNGWGKPYKVDSAINTGTSVFFPSITNDNTIYFTKEKADGGSAICRSRFINGKYQKPELLPANVNYGVDRFNAYIARDESYIILSVYGLPNSKGMSDYYIVFRNSDDTWSEPINMGDKINTKGNMGYSPYVSPDGKYFFFMATRFNKDLFKDGEKLTYDKLIELYVNPENGNASMYWISSKIINDLKPKDIKK